ncbi:MAG: S4 domain-containing protein, partial [Limnohabitans sp.]
MRADQLLVQRGLAPSRSAAQRLIDSGGVRWLSASGWMSPRKAGEDLPENCELQICDDAELRFVSRGGLKLDGALSQCGIDVNGFTCLDVG